MGYAIISVGSKQYRVREGQRLLVDRSRDQGAFTPQVLLVGGDGAVALAPADVKVTVRVVGQQRGPKLRIGKYRQRTGTGGTRVPCRTDADRNRVDRRRENPRCCEAEDRAARAETGRPSKG